MRAVTVSDELEESAAKRVERAEAKFQSLLEATPDAMVIVDSEGTTVIVNNQTEALFGYPRHELVGRSIDLLVPEPFRAEHPARRREFFEAPRVRPMGSGHDLEARHKDGHTIPVEISLSPVETVEGRFVIAAIRDITERKRSEQALRRAEERLRQAHKLDAIGSLAAGIAHDFNNVLAVILSYTTLVLEQLGADDPIRADLEEVKDAGLRAAKLTRQLLAFGRQQVLEPKVVNLNRVLSSMEAMLRRILGADVELTLAAEARLGKMRADPSQMQQVVMNLVVNARDAMPSGGTLTLETANVEVDASNDPSGLGLEPGAYVMLKVTDTGQGMDAATRSRLFEPFFTTKPKGKGTGLGLATVFGIVKQTGGHVSVSSEPNKGTAFSLYFPCTEADEAADTPIPAVRSEVRGTETVLLVEDEGAVRVLVRNLLRQNGYTVLEAQNAGEALLICEQYSGKIDLLLTDVVMPRMSGRLLAERLSTVRPGMHVLYMSGYTEDAVIRRGIETSSVSFLEKPFTPAAMLHKVRDALERGKGAANG